MGSDKNQKSTSYLRGAIEQTQQTLECRARLFRNTVLAAVLLALAAALLGIFVGISLLPLGLLTTVPLVGLFLMLDRRLISRWRRTIVNLWPNGGPEREMFQRTIGGFRHLPRETVGAMLASLPKDAAALAAAARRGEWKTQAMIAAGTLLLTTALSYEAIGAIEKRLGLMSAGAVLLVVVGLARWPRRRRRSERSGAS